MTSIHLVDDSENDAAFGQIQMGARKFLVVAAMNPPAVSDGKELCQFVLDGLTLAVIEAEDPAARPAVPPADDLSNRLSGREFEIAVLVAQGHGNKNIAHRLHISEWTVATYLRRIFLKLDVENRAAMVFRCAPLINASLATAAHRDGANTGRGRADHKSTGSAGAAQAGNDRGSVAVLRRNATDLACSRP
jgi:DNA-binding NarL/FixJ family response regulator